MTFIHGSAYGGTLDKPCTSTGTLKLPNNKILLVFFFLPLILAKSTACDSHNSTFGEKVVEHWERIFTISPLLYNAYI